MLWLSFAALTMAAHYLVLVYMVVGGFLAWRWRAALYPHLVLAAWAALVTAVPTLPCPLTALQDTFRAHVGEPALDGGFVNTYIKDVFYPAGYNNAVLALGAVLVVVSWIGVYRRRSHVRSTDVRRSPARTSSSPDGP